MRRTPAPLCRRPAPRNGISGKLRPRDQPRPRWRAGSPHSPVITADDRSRLTHERPRPSRAVDDRDSDVAIWGKTARRALAAPAWNEGGGETLRTRFYFG